ncbi:hypothetical protein [Corynebacterium sp. HMSC28B08]|uniref:hypothetical protein n=1 Tax=Corynebacterium TaxID=1716 RepID=UPI00114D1768|nr:hypothetical protein [Corynebacterium sp. HMSC28B08]
MRYTITDNLPERVTQAKQCVEWLTTRRTELTKNPADLAANSKTSFNSGMGPELDMAYQPKY